MSNENELLTTEPQKMNTRKNKRPKYEEDQGEEDIINNDQEGIWETTKPPAKRKRELKEKVKKEEIIPKPKSIKEKKIQIKNQQEQEEEEEENQEKAKNSYSNIDTDSGSEQEIPKIDPKALPLRDVILSCKFSQKKKNQSRNSIQNNQANETEQPTANETSQGPAVTVINGEIVLSEESMFGVSDPGSFVTNAIDETGEVINSSSFRSKDSYDWSKDQTEKFYEALESYGSDFSLIERTFPNCSRKQIRNKFKREERINPERIELALSANKKSFSKDKFNQLLGQITTNKALVPLKAPSTPSPALSFAPSPALSSSSAPYHIISTPNSPYGLNQQIDE